MAPIIALLIAAGFVTTLVLLVRLQLRHRTADLAAIHTITGRWAAPDLRRWQ